MKHCDDQKINIFSILLVALSFSYDFVKRFSFYQNHKMQIHRKYAYAKTIFIQCTTLFRRKTCANGQGMTSLEISLRSYALTQYMKTNLSSENFSKILG